MVQKPHLTYRHFPSTTLRVLYGQDKLKLLLGDDDKVWEEAYRVFLGRNSPCVARTAIKIR